MLFHLNPKFLMNHLSLNLKFQKNQKNLMFLMLHLLLMFPKNHLSPHHLKNLTFQKNRLFLKNLNVHLNLNYHLNPNFH
jgi:hypothetical protein